MSKIIIANWKSNKNNQEAIIWVTNYLKAIDTQASAEATSEHGRQQALVVVCPSFPLLSTVIDEIERTKAELKVGVQTLSSFPAGSYTGAVSVKNIENQSVTYAILGHSERRRYFHETHLDVSKQVEQAVSAGITPIVCLDQPDILPQAAVLDTDLKSRCVIAYEPLAAIGSGQPQDVGTIKQITRQIKDEWGDVQVLYGGSVTAQNIAEFMLVSDGALVGGASLDPVEFAQLVAAVE